MWEKNIFIRNLKTFNKVVGTYNIDLPEDVDYNWPLFEVLNQTYYKYI